MKKWSYCLLFFILFYNYSSAQEYYHVTAKSGLNVRASTNLTSKKIAKIPFGVVVEKLENTTKELIITDDGKQLKGNWVKIKYNNYNYSISKNKEKSDTEGFVFDAFIKPMKRKNLAIKIDTLTKEMFLELQEKHPSRKKVYQKIKDLATIKTLLKDRVLWQKWYRDYEGNLYEGPETVKTIITKNNQKLLLNTDGTDVGFSDGYSGYYPALDILVLEGGHSSDVCYSIKFGGETETVGNPEYIIPTPKDTFRLNGYFPGQECVSYFLEKKEEDEFVFFSVLDLWQDCDVCYFKEFYWISETEFIYSKMSYNNKTEKECEAYFKGEVKL